MRRVEEDTDRVRTPRGVVAVLFGDGNKDVLRASRYGSFRFEPFRFVC